MPDKKFDPGERFAGGADSVRPMGKVLETEDKRTDAQKAAAAERQRLIDEALKDES